MQHLNGKSKKTKRVLHVFGILNRGGAEMRTLEFISRTQTDKIVYDFVILSGATGVLDDEFRKVIGGEIYYMRLDQNFLFRFIKLLRRNRYDILHTHVLLASSIFLAIAFFAGIPNRIAHLRSTGADKKSVKRYLRDLILKPMMLLFATTIITVSESVAKAIWGPRWRRHKKIKVIYNGFVLNENKAVAYTRVIKVGHVGRFHESKNHLFLAEVYKILCDNYDNVVCTMTGRLDNSIYPAVVQTLKKYTDSGRVVIQGDSANVYDLMKNYDIFITTSRWEGLPGTIIEAISTGVPVLASGIDPNKEVALKVQGVKIVEGWDKNIWKDELIGMIREISSANKKEMISTLQASFVNSPFYYQNTDKELLNIYQIHA